MMDAIVLMDNNPFLIILPKFYNEFSPGDTDAGSRPIS